MKPLSVLLSLSIAVLASCAVREAPSGGPEDKTPPTIVGVTPESGSTMLQPEASFTISFSEPMQKDVTQDAIFISPLFWGYPVYKWSGNRELTITPPESLRQGATYTLTIGAGVTDTRGNKLGRSQSFAFSTGPAIDSGSISGAIFSREDQRVFYDTWAYLLDDTSSSDFWTDIPDYATQVDSSGAFEIENLGNGRYLVVAVDDKNDDLFWDPSAEPIGLPQGIASLGAQEAIHGLIFIPERRDTTLAAISRVTPINRNLVSLEFSHPVSKKTKLSLNSYLIKHLDSDSVLASGLVYLAEGEGVMLETETQSPGRLYRVVPSGMTSIWGVPFDTAGYRFSGIEAPDTIGPKLLSTLPTDGSTNTYQDSVIELTFSERIEVLAFEDAVQAVADSVDTLQFFPIWINPNVARLRFPGLIPREKRIEVILDPEKVTDIFRNPMPDSILRFSFRLPPADTAGAVAAEIMANKAQKIVGVLRQRAKGGLEYRAKFDERGKFELPAVMPGNYRFEFFEDANGDGEWSPGMISPFVPAEKFSFLADTLIIRSRWTTDVGTVDWPDSGR